MGERNLKSYIIQKSLERVIEREKRRPNFSELSIKELESIVAEMSQPVSDPAIFEYEEENSFSSLIASATSEVSSYQNVIFVSYSHKDEKWLKMIKRHFVPLDPMKILLWSDEQISVGDEWEKKIQHAVGHAKVALLLVTADFLASDFIMSYELPLLINAEKQKKLTIVWIAVGHCLYKKSKIGNYQAFNDPKKPLQDLKKSQQEKIFMDVCSHIDLIVTLRTK